MSDFGFAHLEQGGRDRPGQPRIVETDTQVVARLVTRGSLLIASVGVELSQARRLQTS